MMENVPGLGKNWRTKKLVRALSSMGYEVTTGILDAAKYGVPQRRRRFILLAGAGKTIPFGRPTECGCTVREAFAKLTRRQAVTDHLHNLPEKRSEKIRKLIRRIPRDGGGRLDLPRRSQLECHRKCDGFQDIYGRMSWDAVSPTITGGCCNPSKGRFLHPVKNRNITLREAALLQTFPPDYFFSVRRGKFPAAQMIGNALPPEFIRRHAVQVLRVIGVPP
jgi:DNA (cytosine-5)-methyltransferase 1